MTLVKALSRIEKDGKITLPGNIRRALGLNQGQVVELKILVAGNQKKILVSSLRRDHAR